MYFDVDYTLVWHWGRNIPIHCCTGYTLMFLLEQQFPIDSRMDYLEKRSQIVSWMGCISGLP